MFNRTYYKQINGAAMDSPLGQTSANIFVRHYDGPIMTVWPDECLLV